MKGKVVKVVVDAVLSFMFFFVAAILINWIAGLIFGTDSKGNADFNGRILLATTVVVTLAFSVWFYKYVHLSKKNKVEE